MKPFLSILAAAAWLVAGCTSPPAPGQPSALPLRYHQAQYGFTFLLPAGWRGYSVSIQQWHSETASPAADKLVPASRGQIIRLQHPQATAGVPYQDIPILVFTRAQWDALHQGKLWPSLYAGGFMDELWHNQQYVFAISSRYNADDSVSGWQEAAEIVERNRQANSMPRLFPQ